MILGQDSAWFCFESHMGCWGVDDVTRGCNNVQKGVVLCFVAPGTASLACYGRDGQFCRDCPVSRSQTTVSFMQQQQQSTVVHLGTKVTVVSQGMLDDKGRKQLWSKVYVYINQCILHSEDGIKSCFWKHHKQTTKLCECRHLRLSSVHGCPSSMT